MQRGVGEPRPPISLGHLGHPVVIMATTRGECTPHISATRS